MTRDKEGHYIILTGAIQQGGITPINMYVPNIVAPKYTRKISEDFKREIEAIRSL